MGAVSEPQATISADTGAGATPLEVTGWEVSRDLTGGALPGQVRAVSGFSVGTGRVRFRQGDGATPWRGGPVKPGQACAIDAAADVTETAAAVARMRIRAIGAGSALSTERTADIEDQVDGLRAPVQIPPTLAPRDPVGSPSIDAAWAIDRAVRQAGFRMTAEPVPSAIFAAHRCGSTLAEVSSWVDMTGAAQWDTDLDGRIYAAGTRADTYRMTSQVEVGGSFYITMTIANLASPPLAQMYFVLANGPGVALFRIQPTSIWISMATGSTTGPIASVPIALGPSGQVQMQVERLSATQWRFRARTDPAAAWSSWATPAAGDSRPEPVDFFWMDGPLRGVQIHTADDPRVWLPNPTARIAAANSPLSAVIVDGATPAWDLAQQVAGSTLGALWIDEAGSAVFRNRDQIRGLGTAAPASVVAESSVEDLPWSISSDDVADRVEVSYTPSDVQSVTNYSLTVWQSTDVVAIGAGKTVTIYAELEDAVAFDLASWLPVWDTTTAPAGRWSRWAASTQRDGGGAQPPSTALTVSSTLVSPSRIRLRITNNTAGTLYTAGADGTSQITIRANVVVRPSEAVTLATGKSAELALNPLQVSLGAWVQDGDVAQSVLSWLWGAVSAPLPVLDQVRVVPDLSIRLGSIRTLRDPSITGLVAKVLVVGTILTGAPGSLVQTLRLAVLDVLEGDLAALFDLRSLATEANVATYYTSLGAATEGDLATLLPAAALA